MISTLGRRCWLLPALMLAAGLAYVFYTGLYCSDDTRYLIGIQKIAAGIPIDLDSNAERRLLFLLPGSLFYLLSGKSSLDMAIAPYALFFMALLPLAWTALRPYGKYYALAGALACALIPLLYLNAGALAPDTLSAFLSASMLVCTLLHRRARKAGANGYRFAFMAGIAMSCSFSVKESNAIIAMIPAGYFAVDFLRQKASRDAWRQMAALAGAAALYLLVEAVAYKVFAGHFHLGLLNSATTHNFRPFLKQQGFYPTERFAYLIKEADWSTIGLFAAAFLAAIAAALFRRKDQDELEWVLPALFVLWPLLYFTVGSSSFKEYLPPVMQMRYYAPCALPAAVLVVGVLGRLSGERSWTRALAGLAVAVLAADVPAHYPQRGLQYMARAKDAVNVALADIVPKSQGWPVYDAAEAGNDDVKRCRSLILLERGYPQTPAADRLEPPFLLLGTTRDKLSKPATPAGRELVTRVVRGEWRLEFIGYYYVAEEIDDRQWWLTRQHAVVDSYENGLAGMKETAYPVGYVRWMKREMHAEAYLVLPQPKGE